MIAETSPDQPLAFALFGCDFLQISKESIVSSCTAPDDCDAILGPKEDGGYYLLGLKEGRPELFQNTPWSTGQVLEKTANILKIKSLSYITLNAFSDVDTL